MSNEWDFYNNTIDTASFGKGDSESQAHSSYLVKLNFQTEYLHS